jgi:acyl carrier protein
METKFIELFKETLEIEDRDINLTDTFRDYPEWDSLAFLSVIAMIDEEYDIVIEGNDFKLLKTVGELIEEIKKRKS